MAWWEEGMAQPLPEDQRPKDNQDTFRFYLKTDQTKRIVFLDDNCFRYYEHNLKIGGMFFNYFTCTREGCPICAAGDRPYFAGAFTVADVDGYKDSEGRVQGKGRKLLLVCKFHTLEMLKHQWTKRGGLVGAVYEVYRSSKRTAPSVGDSWDYEGRLDLSKLPDSTPFDYRKILAPKNAETMKAAAQSAENIKRSESGGGGSWTAPDGTPAPSDASFPGEDELVPF